jgi:hypothetical protein
MRKSSRSTQALVLLGFFCLACCTLPCKEPERPYGIPSEAIWHGDCDGGYWLYLVEVKEDAFRFRVFLEHDSTVALDADYILKDKCANFSLPRDRSILEKILVVEPSRIIIQPNMDDKNKHCSLVPVFPAYGGLQWEIIKNKGNY